MFWRKKKTEYQTTQVTDENFNELVGDSKIPVLLDFYADWCGPCKMIGPIINELAEEYQGRVLVAKVNTETNPKLSAHFKIKSIPALLVFHKGELVERYSGLIPKPNLEEILNAYLVGHSEEE